MSNEPVGGDPDEVLGHLKAKILNPYRVGDQQHLRWCSLIAREGPVLLIQECAYERSISLRLTSYQIWDMNEPEGKQLRVSYIGPTVMEDVLDQFQRVVEEAQKGKGKRI